VIEQNAPSGNVPGQSEDTNENPSPDTALAFSVGTACATPEALVNLACAVPLLPTGTLLKVRLVDSVGKLPEPTGVCVTLLTLPAAS